MTARNESSQRHPTTKPGCPSPPAMVTAAALRVGSSGSCSRVAARSPQRLLPAGTRSPGGGRGRVGSEGPQPPASRTAATGALPGAPMFSPG